MKRSTQRLCHGSRWHSSSRPQSRRVSGSSPYARINVSCSRFVRRGSGSSRKNCFSNELTSRGLQSQRASPISIRCYKNRELLLLRITSYLFYHKNMYSRTSIIQTQGGIIQSVLIIVGFRYLKLLRSYCLWKLPSRQ